MPATTKRVTKATKAKNAKLLEEENIPAIMKVLQKAGITLDECEYTWDRQDACDHNTINGPKTWRGRPYSPLSFRYVDAQISQARKIMEKHGLVEAI